MSDVRLCSLTPGRSTVSEHDSTRTVLRLPAERLVRHDHRNHPTDHRPQVPRRESVRHVASQVQVDPRVEVDVVLDDDAQTIDAVKKGCLIGTPILSQSLPAWP